MIELIVFLVLISFGYFFGRRAERRHFTSIIEREEQYAELLTFSARLPPADLDIHDSALVSGNVVVSVDYFKLVAGGLRTLFGGRITAFESLIERARREAVLRMKEQALARGAGMIINVKIETASISKGDGNRVSSVEAYAYGTALKF